MLGEPASRRAWCCLTRSRRSAAEPDSDPAGLRPRASRCSRSRRRRRARRRCSSLASTGARAAARARTAFSRPTRASRSRTASRRSSRFASGSSPRSRWSRSASSSSASGRCRCSPGRSTWRGAGQPGAHGPRPGGARTDPRPQRPLARRRTSPGPPSSSGRRTCRRPGPRGSRSCVSSRTCRKRAAAPRSLVEVKARGRRPAHPGDRAASRSSAMRRSTTSSSTRQRFPGVPIVQTYIRRYHSGRWPSHAARLRLRDLAGAAQADCASKRLPGRRQIGQGGVESAYDRYLRGQAGLDQLRRRLARPPAQRPRAAAAPKPGQPSA